MQNIQINSKLVKNGDIFIAISCPKLEDNINEAFRNGASLVFAEHSNNPQVILVQDARLLASKLAKFMYNNQPKFCVAITGTNGKSSVAHFLSQIWMNAGKAAANLGTLGLFINGQKHNSNDFDIPKLTTPDAMTLHKVMNNLASNLHIDHFVFEASSHALDQKRLHSVELSAAAFTNFASDHLDYHKTRAAYLAAKLKLFKEILKSDKPAIVSFDYPDIADRVSKLNQNVISFGLSSRNFIKATNVEEFPNYIILDLAFGDQTFKDLKLNLVGSFQVMNVLCATALAFSCGMHPEEIVNTLSHLTTLNGRMEYVRSINGGFVYIDYAHTSAAFQNALKCFRKLCAGQLICVFGCGGNRDQSKRKEMGEIASQLADKVIVTDDNPRFEPPAQIREEIIKYCPKALNIADRKDAIYKALSLMQPNDVVAVIGKGHEDYQIYKDKTNHFNDKEVILEW